MPSWLRGGEDDDPFKWWLRDVVKETKDLTRSMDIDNAREVGNVAREIDLTMIAEDIESSGGAPFLFKCRWTLEKWWNQDLKGCKLHLHASFQSFSTKS